MNKALVTQQQVKPPSLLSMPKGTKVRYIDTIAASGGYLTTGKVYELFCLGPDMFDNLEIIDDTGQLNYFKYQGFELFDEYTASLKCECGADATYGPDTEFHSEWCPKYKKIS